MPSWGFILSDKLFDWYVLSKAGGEALISERTVLDVGPGFGLDAMVFASMARRYIVLDVDDDVLHRVATLAPSAEIHKGDARAMPFGDGEFNLVIDFSTFDDTDDPLACYRHAIRVLAARGRLVTTFANGLFGKGVAQTSCRPDELMRFFESQGLLVLRRMNWDQPRAALVVRKPPFDGP